MRTDLEGRIQRFSLSPRHALYSVLEAVSNSMHSIQATGRNDGKISIAVQREDVQQRLDLDGDRSEPITALRITDNGVGFTAENFGAFDELDTRIKIRLGGKGIGRLTWLKVFERAKIESVYRSTEGFRRRIFDFHLPEGVPPASVVDITAPSATDLHTTITLTQPSREYRDALRPRAATIAALLVRHFLFELLKEDPVEITVIDGDQTVPVTADTVTARQTGQFHVRGEQFTVDHLKLRSPEKRQHLAYYCANGRAVKEERIKHLPDGPLLSDQGTAFYYHAYIVSPYLDRHVNEQRTAFDIPEEPELNEVSFAELRDEVKSGSETYLAPEVGYLSNVRDERVSRVLAERMPDLRYVQAHNSSDLLRIPLNATDSEVEETIASIHLRNQKNSRQLLANIVHELRDATTINLQNFEDHFSQRIDEIARPSQASLAGYLLYRRAIVDMYRELLKKSGDRFQREAAVHKLIFPMGAELETSRAYMDHNLWLLDERLTFANYIASDIPLREHKHLFEVDSREEPDLACYYNLGFSEEDPALGDLHSVVLVELKRPGPLPARKESPWKQVMRYIDRVRAGAWTDGGPKVKASANTRFYCLIVCDLDASDITEMVNEYQFRPVFDGAEGYTLYNDVLRAYVELVPFEKILRDAERRHRAFFERLGLAG